MGEFTIKLVKLDNILVFWKMIVRRKFGKVRFKKKPGDEADRKNRIIFFMPKQFKDLSLNLSGHCIYRASQKKWD